jgi:hypothetical protein
VCFTWVPKDPGAAAETDPLHAEGNPSRVEITDYHI